MTDGFDQTDRDCMREALGLALAGEFTAKPNPVVGCVLHKDGAIIGRGCHRRAGEAHAEINALAEAGSAASGATAYVTLEPCAHQGRTGSCAKALVAAGVARVVAAIGDPFEKVAGRGFDILRSAGVRVDVGLFGDEAGAQNRGFLARVAGDGPYVRLKTAASLDARTALANGDSQWITGDQARADVHRYRARSGAIVTGIGTVLADNPRLTARLDAAHVPPLCVVVDRELRCPPDANVVAHPGGCVVFCAPGRIDDARGQALVAAGVRLLGLQPADNLEGVIRTLGEMAVNEVLVEAGARLGGAFLTAGLIDEWVIYMAPHLLGPQAMPLVVTEALDNMRDRRAFAWQDVRRIGDDLKMVLRPSDDGGGDRRPT